MRGEPLKEVWVMANSNVSGTFTAPIVYVQPENEELMRRYPAYITLDFKGKRLDPIERCMGVSRENRKVSFEYVHMDRSASTHEVLAEMDRRGLRPALYEELLGFAEKFPNEQRKHPIVALGSETDSGGDQCVAFLWFDEDDGSIELCWIGLDWHSRYRFLAVRK